MPLGCLERKVRSRSLNKIKLLTDRKKDVLSLPLKTHRNPMLLSACFRADIDAGPFSSMSKGLQWLHANQPIAQGDKRDKERLLIRSYPRSLEVGNTPVVEIPELSDYFGIKHLLVKDEGRNPFGTHKDRKSAYSVERSLAAVVPPHALCILTAGNAGLSLAAFARIHSLPVIAIVDSITIEVWRKLKQACEEVHVVDLKGKCWTSKELRQLAGDTDTKIVRDVTNLAAPYESIALEIASYRPDVLVVPVGGGELFLGIVTGLRRLRMNTRLIGVTVRRSNSSADKLYARWTPHRGRIDDLTKTSSPHRLYYLDDETTLSDTLRAVVRHFRCEPSSAVAFDILSRISFRPNEKVMVLNTGSFVDGSFFDNDPPSG